jgi:protein-S-isoprenylcysteine O-methyltransferase Ste14
MNENFYRIVAGAILFTSIGISIYHRHKADRDSGEKLSRKVDGTPMMTAIRIGGLLLWLSPLAYLTNPAWMNWSKMGLPESARSVGVGIGVLCVLGVYWLFSSIGSGISPTSATRQQHKLVTHGIYRYVRHPLYTVGSALFISFGVMADNWFIAALGIFTFLLMAIRTPKEEANLIEKFGDEYREYMKTTGKFFPKLGSNS